MKMENNGEMIKRFSTSRLYEHHMNALTFGVLVVTGLSQRFHGMGWAQWVVTNLGGIDQTRLIHRYTGICFATLLVVHLLVGMWGVLMKNWAPTIVVNRKDFTDAIDNLKFYFGLSERPAQCDRYDYKQKFEYWGVVVGGILMVMTGIMLWFPTLVFKWVPFVPGQVIPAAKAAHSNEAMLAFLVIVIWHIYNSIFSPEVFPLDTAIFTGKISKARMIHEHPVEYERLFGPIEDPHHGSPAAEHQGLSQTPAAPSGH